MATQTPSTLGRPRYRNLVSPGSLGKCDDLASLCGPGNAAVPVDIWAQKTLNLPATTADVANFFAADQQVFDQGTQSCSGTTFSESISSGPSPSVPMLMTGIGVIGVGEPKNFSVIGATIAAPTTAEATPCFDGCVPTTGLGGDTTARPAVLNWGGPTWEILHHFFQGFNVNFILGNKYLLVDALAADIGMVRRQTTFEGFGDGLLSAQPLIRQANSLLAPNCGRLFVPGNSAGSSCLPPATASVQWGGPQVPGIRNRIWCFPSPILAVPGVALNAQFVNVPGDCCHLPAILRDAGGCLGAQTPSDLLTEANCNSSFASVETVNAGCITIGLAIKAVECTPNAVIQFFTQGCCSSTLAGLYTGNAYTAGVAQSYLASGGYDLASRKIGPNSPRDEVVAVTRARMLGALADPSGNQMRQLQQGEGQ
jgi:hypothetical protein